MPMIQITEYTNEHATAEERGENLMMVVAVTNGYHAPKPDSNAMQDTVNGYLAEVVADLLATGERYGHAAADVITQAISIYTDSK
jgi:hypothetical protein